MKAISEGWVNLAICIGSILLGVGVTWEHMGGRIDLLEARQQGSDRRVDQLEAMKLETTAASVAQSAKNISDLTGEVKQVNASVAALQTNVALMTGKMDILVTEIKARPQ